MADMEGNGQPETMTEGGAQPGNGLVKPKQLPRATRFYMGRGGNISMQKTGQRISDKSQPRQKLRRKS